MRVAGRVGRARQIGHCPLEIWKVRSWLSRIPVAGTHVHPTSGTWDILVPEQAPRISGTKPASADQYS